jgi:hypothetical protein
LVAPRPPSYVGAVVVLLLALVTNAPAAEQPVALADRDLFSCGDAPFPRAALSSPKGVELTADPAARELRRFLEDPDENVDFDFPRRGWQRLVQTPQQAVFGWASARGGSGWT